MFIAVDKLFVLKTNICSQFMNKINNLLLISFKQLNAHTIYSQFLNIIWGYLNEKFI